MIGNKGDFFSVEAAEKRRRGDFVENSCLADGQNELREHIANVGSVGFCLCPEVVNGKGACPLVNLFDGKVYVFDDCCAVEVLVRLGF